MAQYYAVSAVSVGSLRIRPGTLLDSVADATSYNAYVAGGGLAVSTSDTNVAAAATKAARAKARGADDTVLESIMRNGLEVEQGLGAGGFASIASVTTAQAAADAAQVDADAAQVAADAAQATADAGIAMQKRTVTIGHADLTDAVAGEAQVLNIGAVLPANAVVLAHETNVATLFSGGSASAVKLDIGGTDADAIVSQQDVFTGAATGALSARTGVHAQGKFSAQQLTATFTPDGAHTLLALTAGSVAITIWFAVLA